MLMHVATSKLSNSRVRRAFECQASNNALEHMAKLAISECNENRSLVIKHRNLSVVG